MTGTEQDFKSQITSIQRLALFEKESGLVGSISKSKPK